MVKAECFNSGVPLPEGLEINEIKKALEETQRLISEINLMIVKDTQVSLYSMIQGNTLSGLISNVFTSLLGRYSDYKPYDETKFPDLINQKTNTGLEVKASNKVMKGGEGHNGHAGWHIVVCYTIKDNEIEFTQVEIAFLIGYGEEKSDWTYRGSSVKPETKTRRTETYNTTTVGTAKLRDGSVYLDKEYVKITNQMLAERRKIIDLPIPSYSPFSE